jgi:hypothetical protein
MKSITSRLLENTRPQLKENKFLAHSLKNVGGLPLRTLSKVLPEE